LLGVTGPIFAIFLAEFIGVLEKNSEQLMTFSAWIAVKFLILGCVLYFFKTLQTYQFVFIRQKLTLRLKQQTLSKLLYLHPGWFDKEENTIGKLTSLLSTDVEHLKYLTGIYTAVLI